GGGGARASMVYGAGAFAGGGGRFVVFANAAGNPSLRDVRRALAPAGTFVGVGGPTRREEKDAGVLGSLVLVKHVLGLLARSMTPFGRQRFRMFVASVQSRDLLVLTGLIDGGKLTPVIDRSYPLAETADAIRYLETGHARGKVVITI